MDCSENIDGGGGDGMLVVNCSLVTSISRMAHIYSSLLFSPSTSKKHFNDQKEEEKVEGEDHHHHHHRKRKLVEEEEDDPPHIYLGDSTGSILAYDLRFLSSFSILSFFFLSISFSNKIK